MGECQDFVFPRILLYARVASVTYELDPTTSDLCPAMLWPPLRVRFLMERGISTGLSAATEGRVGSGVVGTLFDHGTTT